MLSVIDVKKLEEFIIQMMALIYIIVLRQSRTFKYTGHSMAIKFTSLFLLFHKYLRFTFVYRSGVICLRKKTAAKTNTFCEFWRKFMPASNLPCVAKQCNMSFVKITQSDITNRFWNCSDSSKDSTIQFVTKPCF